MLYYRRPTEPIGNSLYRDYTNRIMRANVAEFAANLKTTMSMNTKHTTAKTDQMLTERFERDVEILIERFTEVKSSHLSRDLVTVLFKKFGIFQKDKNEVNFVQALWTVLLETTIEDGSD